MNTLQAIIIAIVEGITEYLPVSSTGHMIITSSLMGIAKDDFTKLFTIAIQFGAIVSVLVLYYKKFIDGLKNPSFYFKIFVAFLPAVFIGKLLDEYIDALLENVITVAVTLMLGGIAFLLLDKWINNEHIVNNEEDKKSVLDSELLKHKNLRTDNVSYLNALKIGLFQLIAMIPGVSRSAATIIGGLTQNLSRKAAAEFSFFLAVPTMFAATVYKLYKFLKDHEIGSDEIKLLAIGNFVAFIVAMIAIKTFIAYLTKHGFKVFGYYRILIGVFILVLYFLKVPLFIN